MSTLSLPPLSAVRPEKQYDTVMRYLFMLVEELNSRFDEAGSTVEKAVGEGINSFFGDEFGAFSTIQADIGGIRARVADAEGNISTVTQTVSGIFAQVTDGQGNYKVLTLDDNGLHIGSSAGTVTIDGSSINAESVIAGKISADNITAGTISAANQSIGFRGSFDYYPASGNTPAGSFGVIASGGIKYLRMMTANNKAGMLLTELDVGLPSGPTGIVGLTGGLCLKEGEHYGTLAQRGSLVQPQIGQIFFVTQ